ncbi:MAG: hypothetical protein DMD35_05605 [Gemmatimonadetes bacterium]|nr:MAG: hypothetical protein DMD35_05605 [Gemmatimonadota bacterium]
MANSYEIPHPTEAPMAIWSTLKGELDKAGRAAQSALDEGKLRLEQHRAKQRAEAAAASLGYAVYRARVGGGELETERYSVLAANLASAEAEVARLEREIASKGQPASDTPPV